MAIGLQPLSAITFGYDRLRRNHGVNVVYGNAVSIDPAGRRVTLESGESLPYDRLVVAPGIDFKYSALEGYSEQAAAVMPHAWKGGVCAAAIASLLAGRPVGDPSFVNACYSLASPTYGLSIAGVYGRTAGGIAPLPGALGVSPLKESAGYRAKEAQDANAWYQNIVADSFT